MDEKALYASVRAALKRARVNYSSMAWPSGGHVRFSIGVARGAAPSTVERVIQKATRAIEKAGLAVVSSKPSYVGEGFHSADFEVRPSTRKNPDLAGALTISHEGSAVVIRHVNPHSPETARMLGDNRFSYVMFHNLSPSAQAQARRAYPNKSVGAKYDFRDEDYYYPVKADGNLARARRTLRFKINEINDDAFMAAQGYKVSPKWRNNPSKKRAAKRRAGGMLVGGRAKAINPRKHAKRRAGARSSSRRRHNPVEHTPRTPIKPLLGWAGYSVLGDYKVYKSPDGKASVQTKKSGGAHLFVGGKGYGPWKTPSAAIKAYKAGLFVPGSGGWMKNPASKKAKAKYAGLVERGDYAGASRTLKRIHAGLRGSSKRRK